MAYRKLLQHHSNLMNLCAAVGWGFKGTRSKVVDVRPGPSGLAPPACLAISRNSSYLLAAAGGRVTLYNLLTSKVGRESRIDPGDPPDSR